MLFPFPSKHGEVRTTNCDLTTGYCKKHDECTNNFANYILGCYYDPFPPYLLSGDSFRFGGQDNGDISIAGCIKACGEEGFMLAGLRLVLIRTAYDGYFVLLGTASSATVEMWSPPLSPRWDGTCAELRVLPLRCRLLQSLGCLSLVAPPCTQWSV